MHFRNSIRYLLAMPLAAVLLTSCGLKRHPYENPISKDTQQPDKVLFDKAVHDMEHARYEIARLTLQTLINTYDSSEYLAKAKLAIADSWFREGGAHGLAQAEAEYKDFILFYPQMEESAEAQERVCDIHYKQMEKPDRDTNHALRAQQECKDLIVKFPNSKFAPEAQQKLREIQEVLAQNEFKVGEFYHNRGSFPAASNRLQALADQFPLFSQSDDALWDLADSYRRMGDRFENQEVAAYSKIVKEYPLSEHVDDAKDRLQAMNRPVPEADPEAAARMQYDLDNRRKKGITAKAFGPFLTRPDVRMAAKTGPPNMQTFQPGVPVSVPKPDSGPAGTPGTSTVGAEVSAQVLTNTNALDQGKDARAVPPGQSAVTAAPAPSGDTAQAAAAPQQLPTN
ncbi:MAG: outer membrane protein assembly factor BamD, partial [Acidobacteriia bacterium]|nr:outer membrane protein assembly factor BamD [Terriglobia bacterium]